MQFAQAPGKTTSLNIKEFGNEGPKEATNAAASIAYTYELRIQEYGNLRAGTTSPNNVACRNMGN
jgi:hypothetical protein